MSGRTLKDAIDLVRDAAGKDCFRHYDGSGAIFSAKNFGADATFVDWGLAESVTVIMNAVVAGKLVAAPQWQPIATAAERDGTIIACWFDAGWVYAMLHWDEGAWRDDDGERYSPEFWQIAPEPPK